MNTISALYLFIYLLLLLLLLFLCKYIVVKVTKYEVGPNIIFILHFNVIQ